MPTSFVIGAAVFRKLNGRSREYGEVSTVATYRRDGGWGLVETAAPLKRDTAGHGAIPAERRLKMRYPIKAYVCYRGIDRGPCAYETGRAINLSSRGILVVTDGAHRVQPGTKVEIKIEWACQLGGSIPLNLVAIGKVVRCQPCGFAAVLERHEFRIVGKAAQRPV